MLHSYENLIFRWHETNMTAATIHSHRYQLMVVFCIIFHFQRWKPLSMSHLLHPKTKGSIISTSFLMSGLHCLFSPCGGEGCRAVIMLPFPGNCCIVICSLIIETLFLWCQSASPAAIPLGLQGCAGKQVTVPLGKGELSWKKSYIWLVDGVCRIHGPSWFIWSDTRPPQHPINSLYSDINVCFENKATEIIIFFVAIFQKT